MWIISFVVVAKSEVIFFWQLLCERAKTLSLLLLYSVVCNFLLQNMLALKQAFACCCFFKTPSYRRTEIFIFSSMSCTSTSFSVHTRLFVFVVLQLRPFSLVFTCISSCLPFDPCTHTFNGVLESLRVSSSLRPCWERVGSSLL